jgi:predicted ATPase
LGTKGRQPRPAADAPDHHLDFSSAIVRLLADLAREQPVLFILGDLHEADSLSLDLLSYLAQLAAGRPWLLAGAVREEEMERGSRLQRMLEATTRAGVCLKIDLPCLGREDCDQLVRALLPSGAVSGKLLEQIYARSRGNPLFVEELVREMDECAELIPARGSLHDLAWVRARVPARVRSLLEVRLSSLDDTLRRMLALAAAAHATEFSLSELGTWAAAIEPPIADAALLDALDRALQLGFLEERESGYAFRHPLVRSALYEGLPRHRRAQIHAALAAPGNLSSRPLAISQKG